MKNFYGITSKLAAYIKKAEKSGGVTLYTAMDETETEQVYLVNGYMAIRCPKYLYKDALQDFTRTDAPEVGETKAVCGPMRDGKSLQQTVENALNSKKVAFDTDFSVLASNRKAHLRVFCNSEKTPILIDEALLALFGGFATYACDNYCSPLAIHMPYDIHAIIMPVRPNEEQAGAFAAICEYTAEKYLNSETEKND